VKFFQTLVLAIAVAVADELLEARNIQRSGLYVQAASPELHEVAQQVFVTLKLVDESIWTEGPMFGHGE
jgi:hypothetical protein